MTADVHADSAIARATAAQKTTATWPRLSRRPRPPPDHDLAVAFPADPMLTSIDASLPAVNSGAAAARYLLYNI
jgi:hypothetical protein